MLEIRAETTVATAA